MRYTNYYITSPFLGDILRTKDVQMFAQVCRLYADANPDDNSLRVGLGRDKSTIPLIAILGKTHKETVENIQRQVGPGEKS